MRRSLLVIPLLLALLLGGFVFYGATANSPNTKLPIATATKVLDTAYTGCDVDCLRHCSVD